MQGEVSRRVFFYIFNYMCTKKFLWVWFLCVCVCGIHPALCLELTLSQENVGFSLVPSKE